MSGTCEEIDNKVDLDLETVVVITYLLFPLLLLGVKEIDIAATLEHIRDQRPGLVRTKVL